MATVLEGPGPGPGPGPEPVEILSYKFPVLWGRPYLVPGICLVFTILALYTLFGSDPPPSEGFGPGPETRDGDIARLVEEVNA